MVAPSAKPLFRAIQGGRRPDARQAALMDLPEARAPDVRRDHDFYPTGQPEAIRGLLAHDGEVIRFCGSVWESACGDGALVMPLREAGLRVVASDIVDRGCPDAGVRDYFDVGESPARAIITNPPYNLINARDGRGRWLRHALDMPGWSYMALLLSWDWPAARANGLGELLEASPFSYCYLMRWKLDFTGEGSPPQRNAWFVWQRDWAEVPMQMRFMDRVDNRQHSLFAEDML
ncbi:hypothetical protein [Gemmobacter nanjingensis]|nr:hypothetical protein [Gemmobacter nanjingensis]